MAGAAGIAIRGAGKALLKGKVKPKVKGAYPATRSKGAYPKTKSKGYPKAGARELAGLGPIPPGVKAPKIPEIKKTTRDIGKYGVVAGLAYVAGKAKAKKEAKAKEDKQKLEEAAKKHEKKTKEKREKYGKHHG